MAVRNGVSGRLSTVRMFSLQATTVALLRSRRDVSIDRMTILSLHRTAELNVGGLQQ